MAAGEVEVKIRVDAADVDSGVVAPGQEYECPEEDGGEQ